MLKLVLAFLFLTPAIYCFQGGVDCGEYRCIESDQVFCDNNVCRCRDGYWGEGRIRCTPDSRAICYMMGDPHIRTFNNESASIFVPCTQILTDLTMPAGTASEGPEFFLKVTAITDVVYNAKHAAQVMVVALYIETTTYAINEVDMRCDTNGCRNVTAPYNLITEHSNQGLNITVSNDATNGQIVIQLREIEIRFRAEDGSVSIEIPPNATPDESHPGLCNKPADTPTQNADVARDLGLSYDEYLLFVNTGNIHNEFETDAQCIRRYANVCTPPEQEANATKSCSNILLDRNIRECYYTYRNSNATVVMTDYNDCHDNACNENVDEYCNNVVSACGAENTPASCPNLLNPPPPPGKK